MFGNPLSQWGLGHARRDRRFFGIIVVFLFLFYGLAMLFVLSWASSWSPGLEDLLNQFFGLSLTVNAILLLFWAPARVASTIAKQREDGVLDMLRMTGMSGQELAVGHLVTQLSLPLILSLATLPLVLFSMGSEAGLTGVFRTFLCLLLLTPVYCMIGALVGLAMKKSQHAGTTAIFAAMFLMGSSGFAIAQPVLDWKVFGLLGFWGPLMSELEPTNSVFALKVIGFEIPGDLLQVAFLVILSRALLAGLARRYTGEPALFLGRQGALVLVVAVSVVSGLTFFPDPWPVSQHWWRRDFMTHPDALAFHLLLPFAALLWFALESPVEARDLVRGMARRDADDTPPLEERLELGRFLAPAVVYLAMAGLLLFSMMLAISKIRTRGGGTFEISTIGLFLGVIIAIAAYAVAVLVVQLVTLQLRDRNMPRMMAGVGLIVVWVAPVIGSFIMKELSLPQAFYELPRTINPVYGIMMAAASETKPPGLDPTALAICCAAVHVFAGIGLLNLLRVKQGQLLDHANTLVVLPADAYAAPGTLTKRCGKGHLYTDAWAQCPHCEPEAARVADPKPQAGAPPGPRALAGDPHTAEAPRTAQTPKPRPRPSSLSEAKARAAEGLRGGGDTRPTPPPPANAADDDLIQPSSADD
jgi:hypothetical protein